MTLKHLKFGEISDLLDDELSIQEKEQCLSHITVCEVCCHEYDSLSKCLNLLSSLKNECIVIPDFSERTIMIYKSREKKRFLLKVVPAIAASVIIIFGAGFIRTGLFNDSGTYVAASLAGHNETQRIIETVSNSNGRIIQITQAYIDGEFDKSSITAIKRVLQKNNIKHAFIVNRGMLNNPATGRMEDVGFSLGGSSASLNNDNQNYASIESDKVRMRIFK